MTRTYSRSGFLITRNTSPGAQLRWTGWHPDHGFIRADTLAGAFRMAARLQRDAQSARRAAGRVAA